MITNEIWVVGIVELDHGTNQQNQYSRQLHKMKEKSKLNIPKRNHYPKKLTANSKLQKNVIYLTHVTPPEAILVPWYFK